MVMQSVESLCYYAVGVNRRKKAQRPTVATECIRRTTSCTNVFSMLQHRKLTNPTETHYLSAVEKIPITLRSIILD
jgi:hypothetical protein